MLRYVLAAAALVATAPSFAQASQTQSRFVEAVTQLESGRADLAVLILRELYMEAPTPRIRLEYARALMLTGQLSESKQLFVEAFKDDPPPTVKANILSFVNRIDRLHGQLMLGAGVGLYDNPLQQPGLYTLNFGGIELAYEADERYRRRWGMDLSASYLKEFAEGWHVSASGSIRELPLDRADQIGVDASVTRQLPGLPLELKLGATRLIQTDQSFTLPYGQASYSVPLGAKMGVRPTITVGYFAADAGKGSSGFQVDAFVPVIYAPSPTLAFSAGPSLLKREAGFNEHAYTSVALRALASAQSEFVNLDVGIQGSLTHFKGVDPFFGAKRSDKRLFASVSTSSYKLRIGPFVPALGLSCDLVKSNVSYFQRSGCDTSFEVRKIF